MIETLTIFRRTTMIIEFYFPARFPAFQRRHCGYLFVQVKEKMQPVNKVRLHCRFKKRLVKSCYPGGRVEHLPAINKVLLFSVLTSPGCAPVFTCTLAAWALLELIIQIGVPAGIITCVLEVGTCPVLQLPAVCQSLLTVPVQVASSTPILTVVSFIQPFTSLTRMA